MIFIQRYNDDIDGDGNKYGDENEEDVDDACRNTVQCDVDQV